MFGALEYTTFGGRFIFKCALVVLVDDVLLIFFCLNGCSGIVWGIGTSCILCYAWMALLSFDPVI